MRSHSWFSVVSPWSVALALLAATACGPKKTATRPSPPPASAPPPAAAPSAAAAPAAPTAATAAPAPRPPAPAPLVGHVTRANLEGYVTWKQLRANDYTPDADAVRTIAERARGVHVLAIVATWCPDSKREVPRFFKIADQASLALDAVTLVAVDRTKKDAEGLTEKYAITRVPTFVFFRGDREIGRITERATTTLENDIATILQK